MKQNNNRPAYNYFYSGQPINRANFEAAVPENWQDEIDELGEYSYGYYRAQLRD